ncbi:PREDICTED: dual specificity protein kinase Ttk-like [Papilio xuthus]|uniref:Dual specificity protein kinase Ttk-like n=1 Tax=Papilio xuthus TaxID=66420 RepID=A0AAJ6Z8E2_PAPXU|nr:PREDICTED: dual specificity protein kinase Ttk-like [Papilio xuthus]
MTENTESSINSIKLAPMPMSALIANLWPLQTQDFTPDSSFSSCDSDESDCETVAKKSPNVPKYTTPTPKLQPSNNYTSDKKLRSTNKENTFENWLKSNKTYPNKENRIIQSVNKNAKLYQGSSKETCKRSALTPQQTNIQAQEKIGTAIKKTPEIIKQQQQQQKLKSATPKIKSGIRHFTPGSSRKSQSKTLMQNAIQNKKDKVRCELFSSDKNKDEVQTKPSQRAAHLFVTPAPAPAAPQTPAAVPAPSSVVISTPVITSVPASAAMSVSVTSVPSVPVSAAVSVSIPVSSSLPIPISAPVSTPISASVSKLVSVPIPAPVPETPLNRRLMPVACVPTPSYPEGLKGYNTKVTFNTIQVKDKKYLLLKKLGVGGSSEVYKVVELGTTGEYAMKTVYLGSDQDLAQGYVNEVRLLRELQDSIRVIRLYDYEYDRSNQVLRMILEAGETDLAALLRDRGAALPPALLLHYWEEMLHAVLFIHEQGVIHADLKPANFVLVSGRLKLIDFGIASAISSDATSVVRSQAAGTYSYISPEALMGGAGGYGCADDASAAPIKISFKSDVWSLGCILYSMVYGRTPFSHIPNLAKLAAILDPNHRIDYPPADHLPPTLITSLKWCLTYNARERPSVQQLLSFRHMAGARRPLPAPLIHKLRPHITQEELKLLQRAQL